MQVILKKDVVTVGEMGETINVKDGYARNFLIPQGFAIPATKGNLQQVEALRRRREEIRVSQAANFEELVQILSGKSVVIEARVNEVGHLYGSVGPKEVVEAINTTYKTGVEGRYVVMPEHIKEPGSYDVTLAFSSDLSAPVRVEVITDGQEPPPPETEAEQGQEQPEQVEQDQPEVEQIQQDQPEAEQTPRQDEPQA